MHMWFWLKKNRNTDVVWDTKAMREGYIKMGLK